jgi:hypothetical protein
MSRARVGTVLSAVVLALGLGCASSLEHFHVYQVQKVDVPFAVALTDQFDPAAKDGKIETITHFANPARKSHGGGQFGVNHPERHLTFYTLKQGQAEPRRTVRFRNQFGQHSVDVRDPVFLLVPTQKTSAGNAFPDSLDHYKCYEIVTVNTAPPLPVVTIGDQFGLRQNVQVGKPRFFCPPVEKEVAGQPPKPIQNGVDHLAVYDLPPQAQTVTIETKDQFGGHALDVLESVLLIVPTEKQVVVAHQN